MGRFCGVVASRETGEGQSFVMVDSVDDKVSWGTPRSGGEVLFVSTERSLFGRRDIYVVFRAKE